MSIFYFVESNYFELVEGLCVLQGVFWGVWLGDVFVGCGGVKYYVLVDGFVYGEIKCLFVFDSVCGCGVVKVLMFRLEVELFDCGVKLVWFEIGICQFEVLVLYWCLGYGECGFFGVYLLDLLSIFFERVLG